MRSRANSAALVTLDGSGCSANYQALTLQIGPGLTLLTQDYLEIRSPMLNDYQQALAIENLAIQLEFGTGSGGPIEIKRPTQVLWWRETHKHRMPHFSSFTTTVYKWQCTDNKQPWWNAKLAAVFHEQIISWASGSFDIPHTAAVQQCGRWSFLSIRKIWIRELIHNFATTGQAHLEAHRYMATLSLSSTVKL